MPLDAYHRDLAATYRLLATLFLKEPDVELLLELSEGLDVGISDSADKIAEDFTSLFYGLADPVYPFESFYTESGKSIGGPEGAVADDLQRCYARAGLVIDQDRGIPPDHIGIELLFVSYLIENVMIDELRGFFERHIINWVPRFLDEMEKKAGTAFYREIARITKECLLTDYGELNGRG